MNNLERDLRSLGTSAAGVARKLRRAGVRGNRGGVMGDPVSVWLEGRGWYLAVLSSEGFTAVSDGEPDYYVECVALGPILEFLRRFDAGEWEELCAAGGEDKTIPYSVGYEARP